MSFAAARMDSGEKVQAPFGEVSILGRWEERRHKVCKQENTNMRGQAVVLERRPPVIFVASRVLSQGSSTIRGISPNADILSPVTQHSKATGVLVRQPFPDKPPPSGACRHAYIDETQINIQRYESGYTSELS